MDQWNQKRIKIETLTLGFKGLPHRRRPDPQSLRSGKRSSRIATHGCCSSVLIAVVTTAFVRVEARAAVREADTLGPLLAEEPSRRVLTSVCRC
jgi:hypothetical protein